MVEGPAGFTNDSQFAKRLQTECDRLLAGSPFRAKVTATPRPLDSANLDQAGMRAIARAVSARVRTLKPVGVVITHGTDTLAYSAARLAFELHDCPVPVIVTGSMHPLGATGGDAEDNLSFALTAARGRNPGVWVGFAGALLPALRVSKVSAHDKNAFAASLPLAPNALGVPKPAAPPLGSASPAFATSTVQPGTQVQAAAPASARVAPFLIYPGVSGEELALLRKTEPQGIVLSCYGTGTAPFATGTLAAELRRTAEKIPVLVVSQCARGAIDFGLYEAGHAFTRAGVAAGGDMTLEAALAKLAFLIDRGYSRERVLRLAALNLLGELAN